MQILERSDVSGRSRGMMSRRAVAEGLERFGLQRQAYRIWEWSQAARALPELVRPSRRQGSDGLPLPPPILRVQVTGTANPQDFITNGRRAAETIRAGIHRAGRELEALESVLDFGCGCGRIMRTWAHVGGPVFFGSDYNPNLIDWCRQNLPFAQFEINGLEPPLAFAEAQFDCVYALSVFTHLTEPLQHAWMAELRRVIRPGGLLLFSTRGEAWTWKLTPDERSHYDKGDLVIRYGDLAGTNLCAAFHPWPYVQERLTTGFVLKESLPAALTGGVQDLHVAEAQA